MGRITGGGIRPGNGPGEGGPLLAGGQRRPLLLGLPLAWAATLVLAVGVGWMGGELWRAVSGEGNLPAATEKGGGAPPPVNSLLEAHGALSVPGLRVLSVEWDEWLPGEKALHIRQLLPTGDTLELRYLGMLIGRENPGTGRPLPPLLADEDQERLISPKVLEASLPPGWNQVVRRRGRGWLVARAPLPASSLKALLRSLD